MKIYKKVHKDFKNAAKELGKSIILGKLNPINPGDDIIEGRFMFNNLFGTFSID